MEVFDEFQFIFLIGMDDCFSVAVRRELVPMGFEIRPQRSKVVDFSVVHGTDISVLILNRLVASRQIDYAESLYTEGHPCVLKESAVIRTAVDKRSCHLSE